MRILFVIQREFIDAGRSVQRKVLFPIETAFAASFIQQAGHEISCLDLNLLDDTWKDTLTATLRAFSPQVIVSAPQTLTFLIREDHASTKEAFRLARALEPGIVTVYCGPFSTSYPELAWEETGADFLVRGEYDIPLRDLLDTLEKKLPVSGISGVVPFGSDSADIAPVVTADLDQLPFPAYEAFGYERYFAHRGEGNLRYAEKSARYTHYQSSRGCPCNCCFCNVAFLRSGKRFRRRAVNLVLDDLERLVKNHGIQEVHFLDENLTLNKKRTMALCQGMLDRGLDLHWFGSAGISVYSLDREVLEIMRKAGCYRLHLAFESGSQEVLKNIIDKPVNLKKAVDILETAAGLGFENIGYFVIGLPGETAAQIRQTVELASHPCFDYVTLSIATPQAGTRLEKMCKEHGLVPEDTCLADISRRSTGVYETADFTRLDLETIRSKQWDAINFHSPEKRATACRLMGISAEQLEQIRQDTRESFRERWERS